MILRIYYCTVGIIFFADCPEFYLEIFHTFVGLCQKLRLLSQPPSEEEGAQNGQQAEQERQDDQGVLGMESCHASSFAINAFQLSRDWTLFFNLISA